MVFVVEDFWRNLSFQTLPEWLNRIENRGICRNADEFDAKFVGPLLGEFCMVTTVIIRDNQNPHRILLTD